MKKIFLFIALATATFHTFSQSARLPRAFPGCWEIIGRFRRGAFLTRTGCSNRTARAVTTAALLLCRGW